MAFFLALALLLGAVPMEANVVLASETVSSVSENTLEEDTQGKEEQNQEDSRESEEGTLEQPENISEEVQGENRSLSDNSEQQVSQNGNVKSASTTETEENVEEIESEPQQEQPQNQEVTYQLNTKKTVEKGDVFVIAFRNNEGMRQMYFHNNNGTNQVDIITGQEENGTFTLSTDSRFSSQRQLWEAVEHDGGLAIKSKSGEFYLDLSRTDEGRAPFSTTPVKVKIESASEDGFTIKSEDGSIWLSYKSRRYVTTSAEGSQPQVVNLYLQAEEGETPEVVEPQEPSGEKEVLTLNTESYYIIYDAFDENGNELDASSGNSRVLFDNGGNNEGWLKYGSSYNRDYGSKYFWKLEAGEHAGTYYMRSQGYGTAFGVLAQGARSNGGNWVISEKNPNHKGSPMQFVVMGKEGDKTYVAIQSVPYTDPTYGKLTAEKYMTTEDYAMTETTNEGSARCYVQWMDEISTTDKTKGWWVIEEVMTKDQPMPGGVKDRTLLFRTNPLQYHYRIPAVVTNNAGELVVVSDYRYDSSVDIGLNWGGWNGTDYSGYGNKGHRIDLVTKYSSNNGADWSAEKNLTSAYSYKHDPATGKLANGYGDPAVAADRESDKVFIMSVGGSYGFMQENAGVVSMLSTDGGKNFAAPKVEGGRVETTVTNYDTGIYGLGKEIGWNSLFFSSGRIMQSRYIKVGETYRIYTAALVRHNGGGNYNYVFYSDDFGTTWKLLPGAAISGADEAKIDELPNGNVVITSRKGGGRKVNIFTYDKADKTFATGSWGTQADMNIGRNSNGTNGELYIVYAKKADGTYGYLALQSLPAANNGKRQEVRVFYKWIDESVDTPAEFASGWSIEDSYVLQENWSAYSVITVQNDGKIGFVWEESDTAWDIVYAGIDISTLTGGKYSAAFTKGIGSKQCPYEVATVEQANAVNSVYKKEKVNWNFTGDAAGMEDAEVPEETEVTYSYELNTAGQVKEGDAFVIVYKNSEGHRQLYFHDNSGTNIVDVIRGNVTDTTLTLSGDFPTERQLWEIVSHEGGYALKSVQGSYYLNLSEENETRAGFSETPVKVTIEASENGDNTFVIKEEQGNLKLAYNDSNRKYIVTDDAAKQPVAVQLYMKTANGANVGETPEENVERLEGSAEIPTAEMIMSAGSIQANNGTEGDANFAIDGLNNTLWHTAYNGSSRDKHWIQVKLKSDYKVDGLKMLPRQSGTNGMITQYEIQVSMDKKVWTKVASGSWEQNAQQKEVYFKPSDARFVRLIAKNSLPETADKLFASLAELRLTGVKTGESGPVVPEKETREVLTLSEDKFYLIYDAFDTNGNALDGTSANSKALFDNGGDAEGYLKANGNFRYDDNFSSSYLWSMEESEYEGSYYMRSAHSDNALGVLAENARDIEGRKVVSDKNANHKGSPMKFVVMKTEGNKKYVAIQSLEYTDETYGDLTDKSYMTADVNGDFVQWTDEVTTENKNGWWVVEEVMGKDEPIPVGVEGRELVWRSLPLSYHYRIPAIGTNNAGELISVADYRYFYSCDIGLGWGGWNGTNWGGFGPGHRIDLVSKISTNQGKTWSEERNHTEHISYAGTSNPYKQANGYGDPSVVGDRESDKVLVLAVGGGLGFWNNKAGIISMLSTDGGHTFNNPVGVGGNLEVEEVPEGVTDAYDLEEGTDWTSMFITSGRITQSRYIKVGEAYRIYVAPLTRIGNNTKNWVFYSDDFGKNWAALPGCAIEGADEAKVEELPNGNVVITSRKGSGRKVNVFTYDPQDETYSTGSWGQQAEFNVGSTRGTNGDLYITYAKNEQGEYGYVAIQTLPAYKNSTRKDVRIAYKWLDADTATPQQFAQGWSLENTFQLQPTHSAYSAMTLQSDGTFGFLWEENDNSYDITYKSLTLEEITKGKYTAAFDEGIGSVKSPFVVKTKEQAKAIEGIYAKEEMNWKFTEEARAYMNEKYPGKYPEEVETPGNQEGGSTNEGEGQGSENGSGSNQEGEGSQSGSGSGQEGQGSQSGNVSNQEGQGSQSGNVSNQEGQGSQSGNVSNQGNHSGFANTQSGTERTQGGTTKVETIIQRVVEYVRGDANSSTTSTTSTTTNNTVNRRTVNEPVVTTTRRVVEVIENQEIQNDETNTETNIVVADDSVEYIEEDNLQNTSAQAELVEMEEEAVPLAEVELHQESSSPILMLLVGAGLGLIIVYLIYRRISVKEEKMD